MSAPPTTNVGNYDEELIKRMILAGCTKREVAAALEVHDDTITKNVYLKGKISKWEAELSYRIRKAQIDVAIETKDTKMLIWLGKVICGQKEPVREISVTTNQMSDEEIDKQIKSLLPKNRNEVTSVVKEMIKELQDPKPKGIEDGVIDLT